MMQRLYLVDSYQQTFDASVVASDGDVVLLDRTAFYPGGGGQMADRGSLSADGNTWHVVGFERRDGEPWHKLDKPAPPAGMSVQGDIDWDFRYKMMRTHTALHVLCGVIFQDYGVLVTGCQMYPDRARMDFALPDLSPEIVAAIESRVNEEIAAGHPVSVSVLPREEAFKIPDLIRTQINLLPPEIQEVRIVEVVGLDLQADGGTHVANTREIVGIRIIKTENKGKANKRLEIALVETESGPDK